MNPKLTERIRRPGPKKILACDGGGILGLVSVEILTRLETDLRRELDQPELVLGDWFDFTCGTSTGAIIAACIAAGMSMARIGRFYTESGGQMFDRAALFKRLRYSYDDEPLAAKLRSEFDAALGHQPSTAEPHATLGSPALRTLLMMVMRNHSTDSPWPVCNNPDARYNDSGRRDCNLRLPLWQLVRASTAAPTFFPPEVVSFAEGTPQAYRFVFVDGGVTTYNNPAFLAFQIATARPYAINWPTGTGQLLIVSVGTGTAPRLRPDLQADDLWLLDHAKNIPGALMNAASAGWDMACRMLGECRHGGLLDREIGTMVSAPGEPPNWSGPKLFSYVRYDPDVSRAGLDALGLSDVAEADVQRLDAIDRLPAIQRLGRRYAEANVRLAHLHGFV